jgi:hypothetical protein
MENKWTSVGLLAVLALPTYAHTTVLPYCHQSRNLPLGSVGVTGEV